MVVVVIGVSIDVVIVDAAIVVSNAFVVVGVVARVEVGFDLIDVVKVESAVVVVAAVLIADVVLTRREKNSLALMLLFQLAFKSPSGGHLVACHQSCAIKQSYRLVKIDLLWERAKTFTG